MNARITIGNATILRLSMGANVNITGQNGLTPYIGSNGNWWIGITDTGFKVVGNDGLTPYIKNGNWWIGEIDTGVAADAQPWTPIFSLALDGSRYVQKLTSYVGGSGVAPTANIGQYLKSDGTFTSVISEGATYTNAEALSSKADKGGSDKTLKQVEDEIVQLAGEMVKDMLLSESFMPQSATYTDGLINSPFNVIWADGATGSITVTRNSDNLATKVVAIHIIGGVAKTITCDITRDSEGNATNSTITIA